jgi:hypothetical protein
MNVPAADYQSKEKSNSAVSHAGALRKDRLAGVQASQECLSPLSVLQAMACGDRLSVETVLASASGLDSRTVGGLIDRGWIGLRTIYRAAGLDLAYLRATETALRALREAGGSVEPSARVRHAELCLSRALTANEDMPAEQADALLRLLYDSDKAVVGVPSLSA